jgi:hypothetical protein
MTVAFYRRAFNYLQLPRDPETCCDCRRRQGFGCLYQEDCDSSWTQSVWRKESASACQSAKPFVVLAPFDRSETACEARRRTLLGGATTKSVMDCVEGTTQKEE